MTDVVKIRFTKWGDNPPLSFDMRSLGGDEYGTWLWMPPGTSMQGGIEGKAAHEH